MVFKKGMGSHQCTTSIKDEWLTPPSIIKALGSFDLDPCSPTVRPWETAKKHYSELMEDGLVKDWEGRVWCNPPYGKETGKWLKKLSEHKNGTALIFARTETVMFFDNVWSKAKALLFIKGRLHFHHVDGSRAKGNAGAPNVLVAYDEYNAEKLKNSGIEGKYLELR
jgi:hypothetical protein